MGYGDWVVCNRWEGIFGTLIFSSAGADGADVADFRRSFYFYLGILTFFKKGNLIAENAMDCISRLSACGLEFIVYGLWFTVYGLWIGNLIKIKD